MKIKRKPVMASNNNLPAGKYGGKTYAPVIGRDFEWLKNDLKAFEGKNAKGLFDFLRENDFSYDTRFMSTHGVPTALDNGNKNITHERWVLKTEAGEIRAVLDYEGSQYGKLGRVIQVGVYDEQDPELIRQEEERLFSSTSTRKRLVTASEDAGESEEIYYDVCINDNPSGNPVYDLDEAIRIAKEYAEDPDYAEDEITVRMAHYTVDQSGDIDTPYDDDMDVMWNSNDAIYESTDIVRDKRPVKAASEFGSESLRHMNDYDEKYGNSPAKRMAMLFPYFLQDVEDYFSDVDSSWFYIKGTQFYDSNYDIDFEVIPIFDGSELPFGTVLIEYRAQESPSLTAKCQENGDIIATGDSFIDILVEVERYIEETYTEYADNLPAEYWD